MGKSIFDEKKCPKISIKKAPKSTSKKRRFFDQKIVQNQQFWPSDRPRPLNTRILFGFSLNRKRNDELCSSDKKTKEKI